jgi:hypothetical protein
MTMTTTIPQTAPVTPATPRSFEVLLQFLRAEVTCPRCNAEPGRACKWQRRPGVHLGRFIDAYAAHRITPKELERLAGRLPRNGRFGMATIIRDDCQPRPVKPEPEEAPPLYVVVNVAHGRRVTVTDPKSRAEAERFAEREAPYFAGRLEVRPARIEDLADVDAPADRVPEADR